MSQNHTSDIINCEKNSSLYLCRICAKESDNMNDLFTSVHCGINLVDMLVICLQRSIHKLKGIPSSICMNCTQNLIVAHDFNVLCNASEQKFQEMLLIDDDEMDCDSLEQKVEVIIDEDESEDHMNQGYFIDCSAVQMPERKCEIYVSQGSLSRKRNDRSTETPKSKLKFKKPRTSRLRTRMKRYECYRCRTMFSRMVYLRQHMTYHSSEEELWKCSDCQRRFTEKRSLMKHVYKHTNRICEYCTEVFGSLRKLKQHCLSSHTDQLIVYKCDLCLREFPLKVQLLIHMHSHSHRHDNMERYDCNACKLDGKKRYRFQTENQLKGHVRVAHTSYLCSECGKTFKNNSSLSSHTKLHKAEKPFVCTKCPSRFKWKVALTYHMTIHNPDSRKHVCETCGTSFTTRSAMKGHMRIHTGERPFACSKCPKRFYRSTHLRRHDLIHTGEKPFKCKFCDRAFQQSGELNRHLRSHVGENIYQCDLCPRNFRFNVDLKKHFYEHFESKKPAAEDEPRKVTDDESKCVDACLVK